MLLDCVTLELVGKYLDGLCCIGFGLVAVGFDVVGFCLVDWHSMLAGLACLGFDLIVLFCIVLYWVALLWLDCVLLGWNGLYY